MFSLEKLQIDYELEKFGSMHSWMYGKSKEELKQSGEKYVKISEYNKKECDKLGIKYFDVSGNDEVVIQDAFEYLFDQQK